MGNNFLESSPPIKGPSVSLTNFEQKYFSKVNTLLRKNYIQNLYSDLNLEISLQKKSFAESQILQEPLKDINWLEYIINHLEKVKRNKNMTWANELEELLNKETFFYQNKYLSDFFYREYNLKTFPKVLNNDPNKIFYEDLNKDEKNNNNNNNELNNSNVNRSTNSYNELDVTNNLGGSYLDVKLDSLSPNDPTIKYVMDRNLVKAYIKIFKTHIYKDKNHPINKVVVLFNKTFCQFITNHIKNFNENQRKQNLIEDNSNNDIKKFEEKITKCLQEFILAINISLKLFYSTCINYSFFKEEKDDLINLVISLFFRTGKLYDTLFDLYSLSYKKEYQTLQEKLILLKDTKPKLLEITDKYCLDETTLELQQKIIKEKQKEKEENNLKNSNEEIKKVKKDSNILPEITEKDEIIENEEGNNLINNKNDEIEIENNLQIDKKIISISTKNVLTHKSFNPINQINIINTKENNDNINNVDKDNDIDSDEDDDYLLTKLKEEDLSLDLKNDADNYIRKTISNFNAKTYIFPQIRNKIRDTLALNEQYILEAKNSGKLPMPYFSAINLLKKIRSFKTPFEKIIILAAINDQIIESVMTFWSKMTKYIKKDFLFIESNELESIFLYIFIKTQMPEIYIEYKIISNFTTVQTKGFNISYNSSMTQACMEKIMEMKDIKEIKDVRKSISVLANQRFSRFSRPSQGENPFT